MNNTLTRYKLSQLIEVSRGQSLAGEFYAEQGDVMRLTLANFDYQNGGFKEDVQKSDIYYTGTVKPQCLLNEGDIITPLTEQTPGLLGSTARIPVSSKYVQSGDVALVKCNEELIDPSFCYYLLPSSQVKKQLAAGSQQTKIRHTSPDAIKNCIVDIPSLDQQKKIGKLLDAITAKIDENRKQNDLLEKLAKQLYDYWFVQFDFPDENGRPYKSSGGAMVYNEQLKREIPEGWVVDSLYKIATFVNGLACQKFRPKEGEGSLPVIKIREMHDGITPDTEIVSCNIPDKYKIYNGDILFSWSASLEVMMWANGNGGLNQHIFKVTEKEGFSKHFVYFKLLDYVNIFRIMAEARKTTMGHITTDHLSQSKVELPHDLSIINKFEDTVAPIFEKIIQNTIEINSFKKQVSTLLPLLMTGQATLK